MVRRRWSVAVLLVVATLTGVAAVVGDAQSPPATNSRKVPTSSLTLDRRRSSSCPRSVVTVNKEVPLRRGARSPVPKGPGFLQLCQLAIATPTGLRPQRLLKNDHGIILGADPARTAALLLDRGTPAGSQATRCDRPLVATLLRFYYPGAHRSAPSIVPVIVCSAMTITRVGRQLISAPVSGIFWADGSLSMTVRSRLPTPNVVGLSERRAARVAAKAKESVSFAGEAILRNVRPDTVVLQSPWTGEIQMGNTIMVLLSVPPAARCALRQLGLSLTGGIAGGIPMGQTPDGNYYGSITIRDMSNRPCILTGPITVTGLGADGSADTEPVSFSVPSGLELSADAAPMPADHRTPPVDEIYTSLEFSTLDQARCQVPVVDPTWWSVRTHGGTASVVNQFTGETRGTTTVVACPDAVTSGATAVTPR